MILGTAGHIDHGKTALVRALTGVDTDRLPEEKRRGITIELGFAPLRLDGVGVVGVVDVPGHEGFVRTMLAGASGIDLAMLVIAADEGVMPQTREHLAILHLLGVRSGVVALTKCDLVKDADWLALVRDEVRELVDATSLAGARIVQTSAATGEGLDALRRELTALARAVPGRAADDLFRMPVDRVFTVHGTGTVVTGTIWSGSLQRDATVELWPPGRTARVRVLQAHGLPVTSVASGQRAAVGLVGVEVQEVGRGAALVGGGGWTPSRVLRAEVTLLTDAARAPGPRTALRFHVGTLEVGARLVAPGGRMAPGQTRGARLVLDHPVAARAGDRFVLRLASPASTIGGGVVVDPSPPRRGRPWPVGASREERLGLMLDEAGPRGLAVAGLPVRLGIAPSAVRALLRAAGEGVQRVGERIVARSQVDRLATAVTGLVEAFHVAHPLEAGMPLQLLRSKAAAPAEVVDQALRTATSRGGLRVEGPLVRTAGWSANPAPADDALASALLGELSGAGAEPPSVAELAVRHGQGVARILRFLERQGRVVAVETDRYYEREAHRALLDRLRSAMTGGEERSPAELREALGVSRKYLIPLLEHCDRVGYTVRRGNGRTWRGPPG